MTTMAEELAKTKKRLTELTQTNKELQKQYTIISTTLRDLKIELQSSKKQLDEARIANDQAERGKIEIGNQLKHLQLSKQDQDKDIRELQIKNSELAYAIEEHENGETARLKQKDNELREIEHERTALSLQERFFDRKLEDERRKLHQQFIEAKQELKRNYRGEVDTLKQRYGLQIDAAERQKKTEVEDLQRRLNKKITKLENENYNMRTKVQSLAATLKDLDEEVEKLEKSLQRESYFSEIAGTSVVEVPKDQIVASENAESRTLDKKIEEMRDRLIAIHEEIDVARKQKVASERQIKDLRSEVEEQDMLCVRVIASKAEVDRRLSKRIDQLEEQILRKQQQADLDHVVVYHRLEATLADKEEHVHQLKREKEELLAHIEQSKLYANKQAVRLTERLDNETYKLLLLDKEKRTQTQEALRCNREAADINHKKEALERELKRFTHQIELATKEQEKLLETNQKLEGNLKKLEGGR